MLNPGGWHLLIPGGWVLVGGLFKQSGVSALFARFGAYLAQVLVFDHAAAVERAVGLAAAGHAEVKQGG